MLWAKHRFSFELWEIFVYVLFDCDNFNAFRQDTFKKIKAIDNIELDIGKLQKRKILLLERLLKSLNIFGK